MMNSELKARLIIPSSYLCGCSHQSHFFENTVWGMLEMSKKKPKVFAFQHAVLLLVFGVVIAQQILVKRAGTF